MHSQSRLPPRFLLLTLSVCSGISTNLCLNRVYFERNNLSSSKKTSSKSNEGGTAAFNEDLSLQKARGDDKLVVEVWDADQLSGDDLLGRKVIDLVADLRDQPHAFNYFLNSNTVQIAIEFKDKPTESSKRIVYLAFAYTPEISLGVDESSQQAGSTSGAQSFEEKHLFETDKWATAIEALQQLQQNLLEEGISWQESRELLRNVPSQELMSMFEKERTPEELLELSVCELLCEKLRADGKEYVCVCEKHENIPARTAASLSAPVASQQCPFKATFGRSAEAARGLSRFVMLDDKDKSRSLARGYESLQSEFVKYGSIQDMENFFYIRYGQSYLAFSLVPPPLPSNSIPFFFD